MVWKNLLTANTTFFLLILSHKVTISPLNRIGRQLQPVELAAGELADNFSLVAVSRMVATVLGWLTDFLTGAIMESQIAARSKAVYNTRVNSVGDLKS